MVFSGEQNPNRGQQLAMESAPVLQLEDLVVAYPGSADPTLDGLTLSLQRGERLALVGPPVVAKALSLKPFWACCRKVAAVRGAWN